MPAAAPRLIAHRGASHQAPENTLPAFRMAWQEEADGIETDIHLTRDGRLACIHDADTQRITGTNLVVAESTFTELQALDAGSWKGPQWTAPASPRWRRSWPPSPSENGPTLKSNPVPPPSPSWKPSCTAATSPTTRPYSCPSTPKPPPAANKPSPCARSSGWRRRPTKPGHRPARA
ncbi:MAG: hypothetical protein HC901_01285 [Bdellovibrionaceae bacterium]|nr:hypothetical protein [Pseudobdellovibrionaceae bacterium]